MDKTTSHPVWTLQQRYLNEATLRRVGRFFWRHPTLIVIVPIALGLLVSYGLDGLVSIVILLALVIGPMKLWALITDGDALEEDDQEDSEYRKIKSPAYGSYGPTDQQKLCDPKYNMYPHNIFYKDD